MKPAPRVINVGGPGDSVDIHRPKSPVIAARAREMEPAPAPEPKWEPGATVECTVSKCPDRCGIAEAAGVGSRHVLRSWYPKGRLYARDCGVVKQPIDGCINVCPKCARVVAPAPREEKKDEDWGTGDGFEIKGREASGVYRCIDIGSKDVCLGDIGWVRRNKVRRVYAVKG